MVRRVRCCGGSELVRRYVRGPPRATFKDLDAVADEGVGEEGLFLSSFEASADSEEGKLVGLDFAPDGDLGIRENYRFPLC